MDADTRLAEIRDRVQAATTGTWSTYYDGTVYHLAADMQVVEESCGRQIGGIPDGEDKTQAFHDAMFIGRAPDDVRWLLDRVAELEATLERYVGQEPTVRDEMAYLHRCLNAVFEVCRDAEKQATRWEQPLPVPEWVSTVRSAAAGEREDRPDDKRRRVYMDGNGMYWVDAERSANTQWIGPVVASGLRLLIADVRAAGGEIHEIGRTS